MNRLAEIFNRCRAENRAALAIFAVAGYPTLPDSEAALEQAINDGADIVELGVPFSDPMADGPVIAAAAQLAIANGTALPEILAMAGRIRARHPETGLILFSYMNVLFNYGLDELCAELSRLGLDGVLAVDLPLEEYSELDEPCRKCGIKLIKLITPATPEDRMRRIVADAAGFIYYVSVRGVTGERRTAPPQLAENIRKIRKCTDVPVAVGFGIADREAARQVASVADAVVVGSAFVRAVPEPAAAEKLVRELAAAVRC